MKKTPSEISSILGDVEAGMEAVITTIPESEFVRNYLPLLANVYNADAEQLNMQPWVSRIGGHNRTAKVVADNNSNEVLFVTPPYFPRVSITPAAKPVDAITTAKKAAKVDPSAHDKAANAIFNENTQLKIHNPSIQEQWANIFARYNIQLEVSGLSKDAPQVDDPLDIEWG